MDANGFAFDIAQKPSLLRKLAEQPYDWSAVQGQQLLFLGMGSSHFANARMAHMLNHTSLTARALLASAQPLPQVGSETSVIAVSATGNSVETVAALEAVSVTAQKVAVTNNAESKVVGLADEVVHLNAGVETGGVACLTYTATLVALLQLVHARSLSSFDSELLHRAADATEHIIATRAEWLPELSRLAIGPATTYVAAPVERLCSAQQSALMLREGPRRAAEACEIGDWSHIDVYLTKTYDYRLILLAGSPWESQLFEWTRQRNATVISIGADASGAALSLRYPHDHDAAVRLLAETTYVELLSAALWQAQVSE